MVKLMIILFLFNTSILVGQSTEGTRIIVTGNGVSNAKYYEYNPPFKAFKMYERIEEVKNDYPEKLMSSLLSANTQQWVDYNTLGGELNSEKKTKEDFEKVLKLKNDSLNYFELLSKLTFQANGIEMAILKFYLHSQEGEKAFAGALVMQKTDDGWKTTNASYTYPVSYTMWVFKRDVFRNLLIGKAKNDIENSIIQKVYSSSGIDFEKLIQLQFTKEEEALLFNPLTK